MKKFIREYYKLLVPILLLLVIFIGFAIYYIISVNSNYREDKEGEFFQYFYDKKYEYSAVVSTNKKGEIVDFKPIDIDINLDSTPIYYKKGNKVIFPKDMSVVMPTLSCAEYVSNGYSYIHFKNGVYNLVTDNYNNKLNHYFLYDGNNLYFFIESVKLKFNEEEVTLSPFSYVIAKGNKSLSYYDKETDYARTVVLDNDQALVSNDYYNIYVSRDMIDYQGSDVILTSGIDNLNTIDMKD